MTDWKLLTEAHEVLRTVTRRVPSENPFAPSGALTADPHEVTDEAMLAAANAWATVDADAEEVSVPIPPHTMPAKLGVAACALDAAVHAWDIAVASGQDSPLSPALAKELRLAAAVPDH